MSLWSRSFLKHLPSAAAVEKIAKEAGIKITEAEIIEFYKSKMANLSELQLGAVAGGKDSDHGKGPLN